MPEVKIEHWTYKAGIYNKYTANAYQAEVRADITGAIIEQGPVRDGRLPAGDDARAFREALRERQSC